MNRKENSKGILLILTLGVFSIINTEMGVVGILPLLSQYFGVTISKAGLFVSMFALAVAVSGPIMPLIFSGINRKKVMIMVLSIFVVSSLVQALTTNFYVAIIARIIPALFHPVYVSLAFSVAGKTVSEKEAPKAAAKVMMGVSAGMVLGVPIVSFIANTISLQSAMIFFAVVNGIVLIATCIFVPSISVTERMSYGDQLKVLKLPELWLAILAIIFLNGSIFGVYSYFADYMTGVTGFSESSVSILLFVYGLANIVGNMIAGKGLSEKPLRLVRIFPVLLAVAYICLFILGEFKLSTAIITLLWGILAGIAGNINQYWITSVIPKAPDFGNGLFLAATNLGTTIGTTVCGAFIANLGSNYMLVGGMCLLIISMIFILIRTKSIEKVKKVDAIQLIRE